MTAPLESRATHVRFPAAFPPLFASAWGEDRFGLWADMRWTSEDGKTTVVQRFRWIEPGEFMMGSPLRDSAREEQETPRHHVTLTEGFWLADTACTQTLWMAIMRSNPSGFSDNGSRPVEKVSWHDVTAFLEKLEEELPGCEATLPTDAQWEYACRCGKDSRFSFGDTVTPAQVNCKSSSTVPVRSYPPNDWGLYEMHGNVCEWCADGLRRYSIEEAVDPIGPVHDGLRVVRGGSWFHDMTKARSAHRRDIYPKFADNFLGFRICFNPGAPQQLSKLLPSEASSSKRRPAKPELSLEQLAGEDAQMLRNVRAVRRLASTRVPLMIQGPSGAGKEAFARAIHAASDRADRPFVAVNCAAIPESLLESELFGYAAGAFTGARQRALQGKLLQSSGGTLFLHEIGETQVTLQTVLLRVLEEQEIVPLDTETPVKVDLRVISSSHRDLRAMIARGRFREDLYYRLNGLTFELPPLAERTDKERLIREIFVSEADGSRLANIEAEAFQKLLTYHWPGNIRELRNVIRTVLAICDGDVVRMLDLPSEIRNFELPGSAERLRRARRKKSH
jgi:transcriptional regulator with AAA-type ATPase domain/formylglycine-generating enzyme required for sulfatase activity